jgi:phenylpropionate dioxygenase-like ring-hydroxylating dioxygenase large terminal subunit
MKTMLDPKTYAGVRLPVQQASTLPPWVYWHPEWWEREREAVFASAWLFAAREEDVPEPGDYTRVDMLGEPLVIVRDGAGAVRALSASCRHRGTELVSGRGNCSTLTCPYHGWSYSLTGELLGTRGMTRETECFDKAAWSLPALRTETWGGFIFVNFDDGAAPLSTSMGDLQERFKNYRLEDMRVTRRWTRRLEANWKTWVENSRENYHTPVAHRESLRRMGRPASSTQYRMWGQPGVYLVNSGWIGGGLQVPDAHFPFLADLCEEDLQHTHLILFYPNFIFNLLPDHMAYHQLFPEGPESTTVVSTKCFPTSVIARPGFESRLGPYYEPAELFLAEDWAICEGVQRGVRGRLGAPGRFHPQEAPCHAFANWLLDRVVGRPAADGARA